MIPRLPWFIGLVLLPYGLSRQLTDSRAQSSLHSSSHGQATNRDSESEIDSVPSFYHTQEEFDERLKRIAGECKNLMQLETIDQSLNIVAAVIKSRENTKVVGGKKVAMLLFGEHAREIISSETALEFIADLCLLNSETSDQAKVRPKLRYSNMRIIVCCFFCCCFHSCTVFSFFFFFPSQHILPLSILQVEKKKRRSFVILIGVLLLPFFLHYESRTCNMPR